jgi:hypothetical protein
MTEEPGVLGNLPRARPGRRSAKRASARPNAQASAAPKRATAARSTTKRPQKPRGPAARKPAAVRPTPAAPARPASDPLTEAVRVAAKVAGVGVKAASGVLRRLPRI